jgi:8-oxo-dGTP pyrophosphatase MutT (NUDIX family)
LKLEFNFNQSAVIPYRFTNGKIEVLLITSTKRKRWIIPKGYIEFNLTPFESAKKEAYEEAGVIGSNETMEMGSIKIEKPIGVCSVKVFSMEVVKELENYPEKNLRKRKWLPLEEAAEKIEIPEVSGMIAGLPTKIKSPASPAKQ